MKKLTILGSTGSVGTQALDVVSHLGNVRVIGLSTNSNIRLLEQQIRRFRPQIAAASDEKAAAALKVAVADTNTKIVSGEGGLCEAASFGDAGAVLTSVVGSVGLLPTCAAIEAGRDILLANKETLVTAGSLVIRLAREKNVKIIPIDSEHSAIFQCVQGGGDIRRVILTASGGALFGKTRAELDGVTVEKALAHPNWRMGQKITIDSATLMNKGLEVIEAHHLFGVPYDDIEVVVHRESIVHSMVEFADNSVLAQMGVPDMKLPIHYAVCYPERIPSATPRLEFSALSRLTFAKPDTDTFRLMPMAIEAGKSGGSMPTVLNAANEAAVAKFLSGKITFLQIEGMIENALAHHKKIENPSLEEIIALDRGIKEALA